MIDATASGGDENAILRRSRIDADCTKAIMPTMIDTSSAAETDIHLRVRAQDQRLIDLAAKLVGTNRFCFMLASALKEAKNVLLDQTTIRADATAFQNVMAWMDAAPTPAEAEGMKRILRAGPPGQAR